MPHGDPERELIDALDEMAELARRFADAARNALEEALHRAVERLLVANREWFEGLDEEQVAALHRAVDQAIAGGTSDIAGQLRDLDLWMSPATVLEQRHEELVDQWDVPLGILPTDHALVSYTDKDMPSEHLDSMVNRVWVRLTNGADRLDGVFTEFGLERAAWPDIGGGHFGLQPQTARGLDPSGTLEDLWGHSRKVYGRYLKLRAKVDLGRAAEAEGNVLRRWRGNG